ncbi:hypothetical protein [Ectothiorhodospira lacustris]|uniref:hypothetical protein n=1 Tax=Ectothiorhodospira lacustris TaxID=2899127 RepID=UPI001EE81C8C|nr:hypothetical protein [Ectothiorhodospira lacustris]MCG5509627.1 hypothetical protein [Ectothiorhodospira lacustris]MCG5521578.1 hypothetical protein [Ectothiorhodospira lacustris]
MSWYSDPDGWPDFAARPMEWVRLVVADALEQEFIRPAGVCPLVPDADQKPEPGPLDDLPLLPEDRRFAHARTLGRQNRAALLDGYRRAWLDAADREPVPHRKDNVGRRAANTWLLNETDNREADHG